MDTKMDIPAREPEDVVVLGVASIETKGGGFRTGETMGQYNGSGIADE